jgi:hypothetical protein
MELGKWLQLLLTCLVGIAGLLLAASHNEGGTVYALGLGLFTAAIIYVFLLIKWHFDRIEQVQP